MLAYSLKLCMSLMQNKQFRNKVLRVLVKIYMNLEKPDFINVCQVITLHYFTLYCWAMPHYIILYNITSLQFHTCISIDLYNSLVKILYAFIFHFTDKKLNLSKLKSCYNMLFLCILFFTLKITQAFKEIFENEIKKKKVEEKIKTVPMLCHF